LKRTRRDEWLPRFVVAALFLVASAAGRAQTIAELPDDKFKSLVEKAAKHQGDPSGASRAKSYDHYVSWVEL
jgi:hypothetical protein